MPQQPQRARVSGPGSPREARFTSVNASQERVQMGTDYSRTVPSPKASAVSAGNVDRGLYTGIAHRDTGRSTTNMKMSPIQTFAKGNSIAGFNQVHSSKAISAGTPLQATNNVSAASTVAGERRTPGMKTATKKENQDAYCVHVSPYPSNGIAVCGVFDGHGVNGKHVSNFIAKNIPNTILSDVTRLQKKLNESQLGKSGNFSAAFDIRETIAFAAAKTEAELGASGVDCRASGSTAVFAVRIKNKLFIGNIGDSRCILGSETPHGLWEETALSRDHKPDDGAEKTRILQCGGAVQPSQNQFGQFMGPARVWIPGRSDIGGLAIARTMGDTAYTPVGVVPTPEISSHELSPNDRFIVLGSDGIWDRLSNSEVVEIVKNNLGESKKDAHSAAKALTQAAQTRWRSIRGGWYVDDITACVWCF